MAEKRMFAKSIVLSDAFLDMPMSARCLYFTLGMLADDDGFVGAPKSIMRQCGASQDDLGILISKRFVLVFDSGVIVIKHWRINNYLRADRYTETTYLEEKSSLTTDGKGAYTEIGIPPGIPPGIPSIDKGSVGKSSEEKIREAEEVRAREAADDDFSEVMTFYMENISFNHPSSVVTAEIQGFVQDLSSEVVLHAMQIAAERDKHSWPYIKAILGRYRDSGLDTMEKVRLDEAREKSAKKGGAGGGGKGKSDNIFAELLKEGVFDDEPE